ncbi:MAG: cell wall hydrolase [Clostridia bacterium]|nr:cell wall hydrolase [Clostridia bacterium]
MLKKLRTIFLITGLFIVIFSVSASADYAQIPVSIGQTKITGYLVEEKTMVPLVAFTQAMDKTSYVSSSSGDVVTIKTRGITVSASDKGYYVEANGRCFYTDVYCRYINGALYVPIRAVARAYDAKVLWNDASRSVVIEDKGGVCAAADEVYWDGAVLWLSRIIYAESRGEPLLGKIAVGNVVMNRVDSALFPNTIYGVIFDRKYGVQFTPIATGTIYNNSNAECIRAAKMVLEGTTVNDGVLYFLNPKIATNSWIQKNRTFAFAIGNHWFYY